MRRWAFSLVMLLSLLALAACAAKEEAPASPAATAAAIPPEWEQVLAAARKEGKVVVAGPTGADERKALTEPFESKYGISVEYLGKTSAEFTTRILAEREASQYLWDVFVGGTTPIIPSLTKVGALDPIEPALILPEVKDLKNWNEGRLVFADKERRILAFLLYTRPSLFLNTSMVKPEEFKSYKDLLDPKWKGKILVGRDPRVAGPGEATFTFFLMHKDLGPEFIRQLAKQDLAMLRDDRQATEWLAEGRYPIVIGVADRFVVDFGRQGLPVTLVDPAKIKEGGDLSPAAGSVALINRAPHPNAAKVYINWLLSKEGQTEISKASDRPSWRADVPRGQLPSWMKAVPGSIPTFTDEVVIDVRERQLRPLLEEVFGR